MKKYCLLLLSFVLLSCWAYGQLTPLKCPLEKWEVPGKMSHQGEADESDLRAFTSDTLKAARVNRSFKPNKNIANFQLKKEPGFPIYELHYHPAVAHLALKGEGNSRLLPLYLLLHAIAHTDLKHVTANETEADKKAGEWLARLGVKWEDVEVMLKFSNLYDRIAKVKEGYPKVVPRPPIGPITPPPAQSKPQTTPSKPLIAAFTISNNNCTSPCTITVKSTSQGVSKDATYEWFKNNQSVKKGEASEVKISFDKHGDYTITLRVTNPDNSESTKLEKVTIEKRRSGTSKGHPKINLGANLYYSLPLGTFRDANIYQYGIDRWNPQAGMANPGIGGELSGTLRVSQWLGFGLQAGYINYPYNDLGLHNDLEQYQLSSGHLLDNKFILSTGYSLGYYGAHLAFVHETNRWFFSAEPGFGRLFTVFQDNQVEVFYRKEDGQPQATRLLYGAPGTPPSNLWMGKLSIGKKLGYKSDHIIHLSGTFLGANYQFARQSHSFGDNSNPLILNTLRVRAAHVGIGYRILF